MEQQILHEGVVDLFLIYSFIKRLTTPWDKTEAFELGLIDSNGKKIKKAKTQEEKKVMGFFDRLVFNLKRLLEKIPGGRSRIATYAAALLLIREQEEMSLNPDNIDEISETFEANMQFLRESGGKDLKMIREEIANIVGSGNVAGVAPGEDPPVGRKRKKKKKKPILRRSFKDFDVPIKEAAEEIGSNENEVLRFETFVSELAVKIPKKRETLGIPRNKMPQIVSKDYPEFFKYLADQGVKFKKERVAADTLKAVQSDFSREGVIQSMEKTLAGAKEKALIASKNGFIIDGHHRWLVALNTRPKKKIAIIRANVPVKKLLELTLKFPKIHFRSITDSFGKGAK